METTVKHVSIPNTSPSLYFSFYPPLGRFVKRERTYHRGKRKRGWDIQESTPVIDELSRRVIRGERIGEDSRFTRTSERATPPPSPVIIINRRRWYLAEYQSRNVGRLFVGVGGDNRNPRPRTDYVYDRCKRTRVNRYTGALWSIAKDIVYTVFICTGC